jgi:hypothetical protein
MTGDGRPTLATTVREARKKLSRADFSKWDIRDAFLAKNLHGHSIHWVRIHLIIPLRDVRRVSSQISKAQWLLKDSFIFRGNDRIISSETSRSKPDKAYMAIMVPESDYRNIIATAKVRVMQ